MVRTSSLRLVFASCFFIASALAGCTTDFDTSHLPHRDGGSDANDVMMTEGGMDASDTVDAGDTSDVPVDVPADAVDATEAGEAGPCGSCGATETCCTDTCVNVLSSSANCGACGHSCHGAVCLNGSCTATCEIPNLDCDGNIISNGCEVRADVDPMNCGACGRACAPFQDCVSGSCACATGRADCDGMIANGCETDTATDARNCGGCNTFCGANQGCAMGTCACLPGFEDCDGLPSNGCEVDTTSDAANCGSCRMRCGNNAVCMGSACQCSPGFLSCGSTFDCSTSATDPMNCGMCGTVCPIDTPVCGSAGCNTGCTGGETLCGSSCVDTDTSVANCGTCGTACTVSTSAPMGSTTAVCSAGTCGIQCNPGFADCNNNPMDGCEVDTRSSSANCGACGMACPGTQSCTAGACACPTGMRDCGAGACAACCSNADCGDGDACTSDVCTAGTCSHPTCASGTTCCGASGCNQCCSDGDCTSVGANRACAPDFTCTACRAGFADCDNNPANGCEADLSSAQTCGTCGNACGFVNAAAVCTAGACSLGTCNAGFGNCDGMAANGCETSLGTDNNNCGACGTRCTAAGTVCIMGACAVGSMCPTGTANCDGNSSNGCETDITQPANCGGCGNACSLPNATAACTSFRCTIASCNAGFADCDGNAANGCETNLSTDPTHCGMCSTMCAYSNGIGTCNAGTCMLGACNPNFADCNNNPNDGCEIDLRTNVANCGGCGTACPARANATPVCARSSCTYSCNPGFVDCNGNPADGCEVSNATDVNNCGLCGNSCGTPSNGTRYCAGGSCGYACTTALQNCDTAPGCETDITTSATNCGGCGVACHGAIHARGVCQTSTGGSPNCGYACEAGWASCDGNPLNGCETHVAVDHDNCGSCGNSCGLGQCLNGSCSLGCGGAPFTNCGGSCVNLGSDRLNCGSCGHACSDNQSCTSGTCTMVTCSTTSAPTACSGICTNTNADAANCGSCGRICFPGQTCVAGNCQSWADSCSRAVGIPMTSAPNAFDVSFFGQTNSGACSSGPDVFLSFYLAQQEVVYADTFASASGAPPARLAFVNDCSVTSPTCSMASCATSQAQTVAVLAAGTHYLIVDAGIDSPGATPVRVTFQHVPMTATGAGLLMSGAFTRSGTTAGTSTAGTCGPGPDVGYTWTTCPSFAGGSFTASLCGGAAYDTVLQLVNGSATGGGCNDDSFSCSPQSQITAPVPAGAGLHVFFVDGASATSGGAFTVAGTRP